MLASSFGKGVRMMRWWNLRSARASITPEAGPARRRGVSRLLALGVILAGIGTAVVGPAAGTALADCPSPSWVQLVTDGGRLDSRYPGRTITIPAGSWVTHWGDVKPGTAARFGYDSYGPSGNYLGGSSHTTHNARSNGVIHDENEWQNISNLTMYGAATVVVSFLFVDECTGNVTSGGLGTG